MADTLPSEQIFSKTIFINATPSQVWTALTTPELMKQWMSESEIDIITDWQVSGPITIKGSWYKTGFENKGLVLHYDPEHALQYTHLSSLSRLADRDENYSLIGFVLAPVDGGTSLTISLSNFPTKIIYKHLAFYWNVTIALLKKFVEQ